MSITRRQFGTLTVGALVAVTLKPSQVAALASADPYTSRALKLPPGDYEGIVTECCLNPITSPRSCRILMRVSLGRYEATDLRFIVGES